MEFDLEGKIMRGTATSVDYSLMRRALIRDYYVGRVSRWDVCDAHPEISRIARNVGESTKTLCPICRKENLRLLYFVFGDELEQDNGRVFPTRVIFQSLRSKYSRFTCHVVEVCIGCQWNYLIRSIHFVNGGGEDEATGKGG
ncbi:MAG: DUF5318 family protein [Candidatus Geothermincolales bacterium]